jgi:hypothetical protein
MGQTRSTRPVSPLTHNLLRRVTPLGSLPLSADPTCQGDFFLPPIASTRSSAPACPAHRRTSWPRHDNCSWPDAVAFRQSCPARPVTSVCRQLWLPRSRAVLSWPLCQRAGAAAAPPGCLGHQLPDKAHPSPTPSHLLLAVCCASLLLRQSRRVALTPCYHPTRAPCACPRATPHADNDIQTRCAAPHPPYATAGCPCSAAMRARVRPTPVPLLCQGKG